MKKTIYFISLIAIFYAGTVSAELFKYIDENGNVKYTDDLSLVPRDQRAPYLEAQEASDTDVPDTEESTGEGVVETESPAGDDDNTGDNQAETTETSNWPEAIVEEQGGEESLDDMHKRLSTKGSELQAEHDAIEQEKKELAEIKEKLTETEQDTATPEKINEFNKRAKAVNERAKQFKGKYEAFQTEQAAYNERVQKELEDQKTQPDSSTQTE